MIEKNSVEVAKIATRMAISTREEERKLVEELRGENVFAVAVDIGGNLNTSISKIIERALVASKRTGIINDCHLHDGAVVGATREALMQVSAKANGLSVGGKIGIVRYGEHLSVTIFLSIGLLHLNEVVIGIGHRSISEI